ncbi:homoprotocatechuate degradation operon regulator HpaR [Mycoplana rhizolycopersici]|jgi:homoprotocatechuate degradation regulator HpaR|uniref:Homoprotocatechuate degradation operon regulator HpaR n=1 Tax=Mycoplana rhizolycopersici TaxID=2746702 RepID=A0ABX2QC19_9HYPH|nr:homoprotocatechuate degradation operon regulator HpaR [Rhizobium rhizolycopersici]NVP55270.1 homoprotocatechuate degradation operon regulator HpaR [Rhizobium rhizolycopersici]
MSEPTQAFVPRFADDRLLPRNTLRSLPIALLRAREAVMSHFRPMLAAYDVTEQQWRVIRVLAEAGTLDASEVAEKAFILAPSLTRMIKSLEERGYITRSKDKEDGRRILLEVAPAGIALINAVTPSTHAIYTEIEQRYGKERVEHLIDLLEEMAMLKETSPAGREH